jgi:cysteine desulfurase / selenocysteine lyase
MSTRSQSPSFVTPPGAFQPSIHALDVEAVRKDFPILCRQINGKPLVYLDSAATSQKPQAVLDAMDGYYRHSNANPHRGVYQLSEEATAAYESARQRMAAFINAQSPKEVVFTRNTTEAINLVRYSWGRANVRRGDRILLTEMEHHSNLVPWQLLAEEAGAELDFIGIDDRGMLQLDDLDRKLEGVRLMAFTHQSNTLGTINPVAAMVAAAHRAGAMVLVDGAQATPHMPVDVRALGVDFYAFSGHKMCGPTGIGVLWARRSLLEAMPPFLAGGDMIKRVHLRDATWNDLPWKFEAGTPAVAEGIGLGAAVDYLSDLGMDRVRAHERTLVEYALERLQDVTGITVYGPPDSELHGASVSFSLDTVHPHDLATLIDRDGIAVRAGHHCTQPLMDRLGVPATTRASFYVYNRTDEIDLLVTAIKKALKVFSNG